MQVMRTGLRSLFHVLNSAAAVIIVVSLMDLSLHTARLQNCCYSDDAHPRRMFWSLTWLPLMITISNVFRILFLSTKRRLSLTESSLQSPILFSGCQVHTISSFSCRYGCPSATNWSLLLPNEWFSLLQCVLCAFLSLSLFTLLWTLDRYLSQSANEESGDKRFFRNINSQDLYL